MCSHRIQRHGLILAASKDVLVFIICHPLFTVGFILANKIPMCFNAVSNYICQVLHFIFISRTFDFHYFQTVQYMSLYHPPNIFI